MESATLLRPYSPQSRLEYTERVKRGDYPREPLLQPADVFEDERGDIENILFQPTMSVALISSKARALRANHYHRTDWHYIHVLSGSLIYYWLPCESTERTQEFVAEAGDTIFTPPRVMHAVLFLEPTQVITLAKNVRSHEEHEEDVVRVEIVTPEMVTAAFREIR